MSVIKFDINKLKKDYIYLGKKLVDNEVKDNYVHIDKLQRVAIVGTSGGGKSNMINLILLNLLFNIKNIEKIIFSDFKGGIEAQPLYEVAKEFKLNIIICTKIEQLHSELLKVEIENEKRMEYNRINSLKKFNGKIIYNIIDEFSQIGLAKPVTKEGKEKLQKIMSIYIDLHSTARSQKIYNITITQSFLQNASGLPSDVKTNLTTKIMFNTDNKESIQSVFSSDILETNNLNPKELDIGQFILKTIGQINQCKAILVENNIKPQFIQVLNYKRNYNFTYKFFEQLKEKIWFVKFEKETIKFNITKYANGTINCDSSWAEYMYLPKFWTVANLSTGIISILLNSIYGSTIFIGFITLCIYIIN